MRAVRVLHPDNPSTRSLMSASNLETALVPHRFASATLQKPFHNGRGQSRAPDNHDPAEDRGHSFYRRSERQMLCLWASYGYTISKQEVAVVLSAFRSPLLQARSH